MLHSLLLRLSRSGYFVLHSRFARVYCLYGDIVFCDVVMSGWAGCLYIPYFFRKFGTRTNFIFISSK